MPNQRDVEFDADGVTIRGWLKTPDGAGPHAVVILGHGLGGLKEWTLPHAADIFVEAGFAAMAFDYRNFGDSDGTPREEVDNYGRIEDWRSAITYATTRPEIDHERIGIWGTSLGGRDVLVVAAMDRRVKCTVSQVPLIEMSPLQWAHLIYDGDIEKLYKDLADDRRDRMLGKEPRYVPFGSDDPGTDYWEYRQTWGEAERRNYVPRLTLRSFEPNSLYHISSLMKFISPTPLLMLIANNDTACNAALQKEVFESLPGPKSLVELEGHHYSLYTTKMDEALAAARVWFGQHLARRS